MTEAARHPTGIRRVPGGGRARRLGRVLLRTATITSAVGAGWTFIALPLIPGYSQRSEDFEFYYGAARAVSRGASPYVAFDAGPANMPMSGYTYPPLLAWLLQPLARLPEPRAATIFLWFGLACTITATITIARTVLPATWPRMQLAVVAALIYPPATYNLWHGQMNPLVLLVIAAALWAYVNERQVLCGALIGLAGDLKVAPIVLGIVLLRRGWWRGVAAVAATGITWLGLGILTLGEGALRTYAVTVIPALSRQNGWLYNQSFAGLVNRAADHSILVFDPASAAVQVTTLLLVAGSAALAAWAVRPGPRSRSERAGEFGVAVAAMIMCATVSWYPHETHLLVPMAAAAALAAQRPARLRRWLIAGLVVSLATISLVGPALIAMSSMDTIRSIHAGRWWYGYLQLWSLPAMGTTALLVVLAVATAGTNAPPCDDGMTAAATPE